MIVCEQWALSPVARCRSGCNPIGPALSSRGAGLLLARNTQGAGARFAGMKQTLSEMAVLADAGFWVALAIVLVPYGHRRRTACLGGWLRVVVLFPDSRAFPSRCRWIGSWSKFYIRNLEHK